MKSVDAASIRHDMTRNPDVDAAALFVGAGTQVGRPPEATP